MIRPHPCIISIESALPRVGVWGRPSPAIGTVRRKGSFPRRPLLHVHRFCRLRSQEPLFQQKQTLLCSRQSSRCRCQNCCPRHLKQQNHTNENLHKNNIITSSYWFGPHGNGGKREYRIEPRKWHSETQFKDTQTEFVVGFLTFFPALSDGVIIQIHFNT